MHCWSARLIGLPPEQFVVGEFPLIALLAFCGSERGAREDGLRRIPCWPESGHRMKIEVAVRTTVGHRTNRGAGSHLSPDCSDRSRMSSRVERQTAPATFARSQCTISGAPSDFVAPEAA